MIKQFQHPSNGDFVTFRNIPAYQELYEYKYKGQLNWMRGKNGITEDSIALIKSGWKEVTAAVDPNDIQPILCPHVYNVATDTCKLCNKGWNEILWDTYGAVGKKPCCGGVSGPGPYFYTKGAWHQSDCIEMAPKAEIASGIDYRPAGSKKGLCTCGSAAVGSDRHSDYCDIK